MIQQIEHTTGRKSGLVELVVRGRRNNSWAFDMITAAQREASRRGLRIVAYTDAPEPGAQEPVEDVRDRARVVCGRLPIDARSFWCEPLVPADVGQRAEAEASPAEDLAT